jgi:hypothetical protein
MTSSLSRHVLLALIILVSTASLSFQTHPKSLSFENTKTLASVADTQSPSFSNQEILDPDFDWINMKDITTTTSGDPSTNIESVDYYSDGRTLNAILWLYFPFQIKPFPLNEDVNYGMYIDADFDDKTGFGGIEYKVELTWNNRSKQWTKLLEKWSHFGDTVVLENQTIPYTNFTKKDVHYVLLSADLDAMLSPTKYKVIFYAEARRGGFLITDFTRFVAIPPLELTLSSSPRSVEMRKGEQETIEVRVNTTQGYEPTVNLNASSQSNKLVMDFTQNDTSHKPTYTLRVPSYGVVTTPLTITSKEDASPGPYTIFVFANSSFPPEELIRPKNLQNLTTDFLPSSVRASQNIFTQSSLVVRLQEQLTWIDYLSDFWNKLGEVVTFVTGIVAGYIGPWIFRKLKDYRDIERK